ncbi:hypothetical protein QBC47DRAFT_462933 [Echria macrotheca]|uniref:Uncharacterized protein n=1 Tax=Echria macrotheca TaxID=438768 RepID=A0AAJ0B7W9_9PEZI|nr:hypothetical protein QBC47DRAFT_462933 [Echria macrotheca]
MPLENEFSSDERIMDHISLMRKFRSIIQDAEAPGAYVTRYPDPPKTMTEREAPKWRVQCLLMMAEFRYSMYLHLLESFAAANVSKQTWPLPPWDVAIILYAHMLSPFAFEKDISAAFPKLWEAGFDFPLNRMRSTSTSTPSQVSWNKKYPEMPYQIIEFGWPDESNSTEKFLSTDWVSSTWHPISGYAMDITGFKCPFKCAKRVLRKNKGIRSPTHRSTHSWTTTGDSFSMCKWAGDRVRKTFQCPTCMKSIGHPWLPQQLFSPPLHLFDNLWASPLRQLSTSGFVDRILALPEPSPPASPNGVPKYADAVERYRRFLELLRDNPGQTMVPTLDIDLVWHTHQLSPAAYAAYCETHVGRAINHDDTIRAAYRSTGQDTTAVAWALRFGQSYFDPDNRAKQATIASRVRALDLEKANVANQLTAFENSTVAQAKRALDQASNELQAANNALEQARVETSSLGAQVAGVARAVDAVKPLVRVGSLKLFYGDGARQERRELKEKRRSIREEHVNKQTELHELTRKARHAEQELDRCAREVVSLRKDRQRLERRLSEQVASMTAAVCVFDESGGGGGGDSNYWYDQPHHHHYENPYDGSWYSIVPSETQPCIAPIVDVPDVISYSPTSYYSTSYYPTSYSSTSYSSTSYSSTSYSSSSYDSGGYSSGGRLWKRWWLRRRRE